MPRRNSGPKERQAVKGRQPGTWADVGVQNAGLRTTVLALSFAYDWGMATAVLEAEPESVEEYVEVTQTPRATAFRQQKAFRKAFPRESTPTRMNEVSGMQSKYDDLASKYNYNIRKAEIAGGQALVFELGSCTAM
jgi:hypothetical protein